MLVLDITVIKIKKVALIAIAFALSTYLILNGFAMLEKEDLKVENPLHK